eukprot:GHUV01029219.1.p1 GENE.GHUV01029219.1~~GHUV01029219.1.p1  ORF type:complete len:155 (+),score=21.75 GHUV01029219.1:92-556(+)
MYHLWSAVWRQDSPLWTRHQAMGQEAKVCAHLDQVLQQLSVRRLIVGHTPQDGGRVTTRCGGKLLLLDTGMSVGMMDSPAAAWICHSVINDVSSITRVSDGAVDGDSVGSEENSQILTGSRGTQQQAGKQLTEYRAAWSAVVYADGAVQTVQQA